VPAVEYVDENFPPGATEPESQLPWSAVVVCATVSVLVHVTVPPTAISSWSGAKARFPSVDAPSGIETGVPPPDGAGAGAGAGVGEGAAAEYPLAQALATTRTPILNSRRNLLISLSSGA